ncbi:MAG: ATP-binding protein [Desulfobulbaceae bacterium]|nr:ATP-binding protein [Desulfobulbaceae bacterium]
MEAIGTLAGGIAHDFNNILAAIFGYSQLVARKLPAESPLRNHMEQVLNASSRAAALVRQILTLSRKSEPKKKAVQLSLIVDEVLKLIRSSIPSFIEIRQEILLAPNEDILLADETQIHQVLMNLCTNAAHAMSERDGVLTVRLGLSYVDSSLASMRLHMRPGTYIEMVVSDTGHGMDADTLERIFDPYFTTKELGEGTGLGLATVQGIVKSHGGQISVNSRLGQGTTFTLLFPQMVFEPTEPKEADEITIGGVEHILFVDDEEVLVNLGKNILQELGYEVTAKTDSQKALEEFRAKPGAFDLLITDMLMPKLTGKSLAEEILSICPNFPIILCTGYCNDQLCEQAGAIGIRNIIIKPYDVRTLSSAIREMLDNTGDAL